MNSTSKRNVPEMLLRRQCPGNAAERLFCVSLCFGVVSFCSGDVMAASQLDDRAVVRWIQESLHEDPRVEASQVKATFEKGVATLNGSVTTLAQREHATSIVRRVYGVTAVNNQLFIETTLRADQVLADEIAKRISLSSAMRGKVVHVDVVGRVATLRGTVDFSTQRREADWLAREVRGIITVHNEIVVKSPLTRQDSAIREELEVTLREDVFLAGLPISVSVRNAAVTLEGRVPSASQKRRAESLALSLSSVFQVINNIQVRASIDWYDSPLPAFPNDSQLAEFITNRFRGDTRIRPRNIVVSSVNGNVTLRGTVPTYYERDLAQFIARDIRGVTFVNNLITVQTPQRSDTAIIDDINYAFRTDSALDGRDIIASSRDGNVVLSGQVSSFYAKSVADDVASRIVGVKTIRNDIVVVTKSSIADAAIRERVRTGLRSCSLTLPAESQIAVAVQDGVATLSGNVDRLVTRREATRVAITTPGVLRVVNRLLVQGRVFPPEESTRPNDFYFRSNLLDIPGVNRI